jgi:hypothetical protein
VTGAIIDFTITIRDCQEFGSSGSGKWESGRDLGPRDLETSNTNGRVVVFIPTGAFLLCVGGGNHLLSVKNV